MNNTARKLVYCALCLALCIVLPFLTGQIPEIGNALSPMHIPVLLCGFICGAPWGAAAGFVAPLLRFALFGMPPLFPTGLAMAFELAAYGFFSGLLYKICPKKNGFVYFSLIASMLLGRVVWGAVMALIAGLGKTSFGFAAFIAGAFTNALPGIVCHIVLIPIIVIALKKAKLIANDQFT